jgi:predicted amidohydrolase
VFLAACVQLNGSSDIERNLSRAEQLIRNAATKGAKLIVTPEATTFLGPHSQKLALAEDAHGHTHQIFSKLADELNIHLLIGSLVEKGDSTKVYNTSVLFGPDGGIIAKYQKIHLFDVSVPGGVTFKESDTCIPGTDVVVADTSLGKIGLTICYDLRFPEIYAALVAKGAEIITVPSAFTMTTGKAHWSVLLRARAIETQAWVLAPGQCGEHDDSGLRHSYGHSLIVDPWGKIVDEAEHEEGIVFAQIDLEQVREIRRKIPVGSHRRV